MKFCPKCGAQMADGAFVCGACGTQLNAQPQAPNPAPQQSFNPAAAGAASYAPAAAAPATEKVAGKTFSKKLVLIVVAVLAAALIACLVLFIIGRSEKSVIKTVLNAVEDPDDWEDVYDILCDDYFFNKTEDNIKDRVEERIIQFNKAAKQLCGDDFEIDYEILSIDYLTGKGVKEHNNKVEEENEKIENKKDRYEDFEFVDGAVIKEYQTISGSKSYTLKVTISGDGKTYEGEVTISMVKKGLKWYLSSLPYVDEDDFEKVDD